MEKANVSKSIIPFLLGHFRKFPGMYLGENKISLLDAFITGHTIGLFDNNINAYSDPFWGGDQKVSFFNWYGRKTGRKESSSWFNQIHSDSKGTEQEALSYFFERLEEYNNEVTKFTIEKF